MATHPKVRELAQMIDHSLLHPTMTDADMAQGCEIALEYGTASVCIKPYAVPLAVTLLQDSPVLVGTVIGFPHGNSTIDLKVAETLQACKDGAVEIDMVVNIGKVLQEDWAYVEKEIAAVHKATLGNGGILKVIFENDFLPGAKYKIKLCELCSQIGVAYVKTSTGYGFSKGIDGRYGYQGATDDDLILMRKHSAPTVQVKAAGGVRTLEDLLRVKALGVRRVGASATVAILEEAKVRYGNGTVRKGLSKDSLGY
ncbi:MAG: deoxyribose-phosphate aldolase [Bacteroidota bacterium]